jgi:hypothetical protein
MGVTSSGSALQVDSVARSSVSCSVARHAAWDYFAAVPAPHAALLNLMSAAASPVPVLVFKDVTAGVQSLAAAIAFLVGGVWAYYKFFRSRTFRPRLEGEISSEFIRREGALLANITLTLRNVGLTRLDIHQKGSGLRVLAYDGADPEYLFEDVPWERVQTLAVLQHHEWIEPSERVSDRLLLYLGQGDAVAYKFDLRLVAGTKGSAAPAHRIIAIGLVPAAELGPASTGPACTDHETATGDPSTAGRPTREGAVN